MSLTSVYSYSGDASSKYVVLHSFLLPSLSTTSRELLVVLVDELDVHSSGKYHNESLHLAATRVPEVHGCHVRSMFTCMNLR